MNMVRQQPKKIQLHSFTASENTEKRFLNLTVCTRYKMIEMQPLRLKRYKTIIQHYWMH